MKQDWTGWGSAAALAALCTLLGTLMVPRFDIVNVAMVYLLSVVVIALCFSRGAAVLSALLCVGALDYMFVPPLHTFNIHDTQYLLTFAIMLTVALVISQLMAARRRHDRQRAALELRAQTERIRSTLLASISHDLRTPLAVMTGASSSLAEAGSRLDEKQRAALAASIYAQALDMSEQMNKILQMTRLEAGSITVAFDWIAIGEIVGSVLARLKERLARHRVAVALPSDLPLVKADAALIEQALANLLENAARHTPPGTPVQIRAQAVERELVVTVEDFGPGIPAADFGRLFDKFERRGDSAHGEDGGSGGVGLGLAICRAILELHQGRVWADELPDGGIAFRFALPLSAVPPAPAREADDLNALAKA